MGKSFECHRKSFADNQTDAIFNAAVITWLDSLNIGNDHCVHCVNVVYQKKGYWVVTVICEA